jgi:hypothetical protein
MMEKNYYVFFNFTTLCSVMMKFIKNNFLISKRIEKQEVCFILCIQMKYVYWL